MDLLIKFHADFNVRNAVKDYLIEHLKHQAVTKAFNGDDTTGIQQAKKAIDDAFRELDNRFSEKKLTKNISGK